MKPSTIYMLPSLSSTQSTTEYSCLSCGLYSKYRTLASDMDSSGRCREMGSNITALLNVPSIGRQQQVDVCHESVIQRWSYSQSSSSFLRSLWYHHVPIYHWLQCYWHLSLLHLHSYYQWFKDWASQWWSEECFGWEPICCISCAPMYLHNALDHIDCSSNRQLSCLLLSIQNKTIKLSYLSYRLV